MQDRFIAGMSGSNVLADRHDLFNGNISAMVSTIQPPATANTGPLPQATAYKYDQLNRLIQMQAYANLDYTNNLWINSGLPYDGRYENTFTYNANGGMLTAKAKNEAGQLIDDQTYHRRTVGGKYINNRTYAITDAATQTSGEDLLNQQNFDNINLSNNNYDFTEIGERKKDELNQIAEIKWTASGKIKEIIRNNGSSKYNIKFDYDAQNNRIAKHVYTNNNTWLRSEYYIRDAQGNILSTYEQKIEQSSMSFAQTEKHIYGSSMHGIENTTTEMIGAPPIDVQNASRTLSNKNYYANNHLSNTLVIFTDKKYPFDTNTDGTVDGYLPDVIASNDYAPFGARLAERTFNKNKTINSFNGKRDDAELDGMQDYGMRPYSPMEREFFNPDPLIVSKQEYPYYSPFQFAGNTPIQAIDLDGLEPAYLENGIWIPPGDQFKTNPPVEAFYTPPQNKPKIPDSEIIMFMQQNGMLSERKPASGALETSYPELLLMSGPAIKTGSKIADLAVDLAVNPFGRTKNSSTFERVMSFDELGATTKDGNFGLLRGGRTSPPENFFTKKLKTNSSSEAASQLGLDNLPAVKVNFTIIDPKVKVIGPTPGGAKPGKFGKGGGVEYKTEQLTPIKINKVTPLED